MIIIINNSNIFQENYILGLPRVNCYQFMHLVLSLLVLRVGYGI